MLSDQSGFVIERAGIFPRLLSILLPTEAAAMSFLQRLCLVLAHCAWLTPSLLSAQQLSQPASMLPWQVAQPEINQPEMYLALNSPIRSSVSDSPAWLLDTAKPLSRQSHKGNTMPMIETESFSNLGQMNKHSTAQNAQSGQRKRTSRTSSHRSFNFFRALGIQASRSGSRR